MQGGRGQTLMLKVKQTGQSSRGAGQQCRAAGARAGAGQQGAAEGGHRVKVKTVKAPGPIHNPSRRRSPRQPAGGTARHTAAPTTAGCPSAAAAGRPGTPAGGGQGSGGEGGRGGSAASRHLAPAVLRSGSAPQQGERRCTPADLRRGALQCRAVEQEAGSSPGQLLGSLLRACAGRQRALGGAVDCSSSGSGMNRLQPGFRARPP